MSRNNKDEERKQLLDDFYDTDEEDDAFDVPKPKKPAPAAAGGSRTGSSSGGGAATSGSDKMQKVKSQVNEVIGVMHQNIEKVLDRGAKLDDIEDRTDQLSQTARNFSTRSRQLRRQMWWKNCKVNLIIASICLVIIIIIVVSIVASRKST